MNLSICIPTFNRAAHLQNCLNSIIANRPESYDGFQLCVSDNGSDDDTEKVVREAQKKIKIKYQKNEKNVGIPRNFLKVVNMADGEFVWLLGDDDLLAPNALEELEKLLNSHVSIDFFYINSFHLTTEYVFSYPQPFNIKNLPEEMTPFSSWKSNSEIPFLDLIDPKKSFDFLGGMFLSVFRRKKWDEYTHILDKRALKDPRTFSHFDNTFPHVKIFANAFSDSVAYFYASPLSICLTGAREWAPMYPLVHSVRLPEALQEYRKNGLSYRQYWRCRNFALNNFIPDLGSMFLNREHSGFNYINPVSLILQNCLYPGFYMSFANYMVRKSRPFVPNWMRSLKSFVIRN